MPLSEYERQVLLFKLHVEMVPNDAGHYSVASAVQMIEEAYKAGNAYMMIGEHLPDDDGEGTDEAGAEEDGENVILIKDMTIDKNGIANILLHHGDTPRTSQS